MAGRWVTCVVCCALSALGCRFDPAGIAADDRNPQQVDAGIGLVPDSAPAVDATVPAPDAAPPPLGPGELEATPGTPVLDGVDDDWQPGAMTFAIADGEPFLPEHPQYQASATAHVRAMHDATRLYFFIQVEDDVRRSDSLELYEDDAVHLYLDAGSDGSGPYGDDDHELVIRADGSVLDYAHALSTVVVQGVVEPTDTGYVIEIGIDKDSLGSDQLDERIGFDLALTDDDGIGGPQADGYGLWYARPAQRCEQCCLTEQSPRPWCDTTFFGALLLR